MPCRLTHINIEEPMEKPRAELKRRKVPFEAEEIGKSACAEGLPES
jgi:hypothetical protein